MTVIPYLNMASYQPVTSLNCSKEIVYGVPADQWLATSKKTQAYSNAAGAVYERRHSNKFEGESHKFSKFPQDRLLKTEVQKGLRDWLSSHTSKEPKNDFFCTYQANNQYHMNSYFSILNIVKDLSRIARYTWATFFIHRATLTCPNVLDPTEAIGNISDGGMFNVNWMDISTKTKTELTNLQFFIERTKSETLISDYINKYSIPALFWTPYSSAINHFIESLIESGGYENIFSKEFFNKLCNTLIGSKLNRTIVNSMYEYSLAYPDTVIEDGFKILELSSKRICKNSRAPNSKNQDFIYTYLLYGSLPLLIAILGLIAYRLKKPCNIGKRARQENLQKNKEPIDHGLNELGEILSKKDKMLFQKLPEEFKDPRYLL